MVFNSANTAIDDTRRALISSALDDLFILGTYFHELFCTGVVEGGVPPGTRGAPLSPRQRECLVWFSPHMDLTTEEIAVELGITQRTAQFHFDSIVAGESHYRSLTRKLRRYLSRQPFRGDKRAILLEE